MAGFWIHSQERAKVFVNGLDTAREREGGTEAISKVLDWAIRRMQLVFTEMERFLREQDLKVKSLVLDVEFENLVRYPSEDVK